MWPGDDRGSPAWHPTIYLLIEENVCRPGQALPGTINADDSEGRVWHAIEAVLQQPELIAAEVQRQQANADEQRATIGRELSLIDEALAKYDREEERWAQAYSAEVIDLAELKGYGAEIAARRQSLLEQRQQLQTKLQTIGEAVDRAEALMGYCARVRQRLERFDSAEKRLAFEALNVRVTWTLGQPLAIEGTIPLSQIAPVPIG
jgi:hypothetical protein